VVRRAHAPLTAAGTALLLAALAGCGSSGPTRPVVLHAAPEPARAPAPTTAPAGRVIELGGGRPEGIVADPVSGLVAVAVREPNRLLLVDPALGRVVRTVIVPGSARHLELAPGGGAVYVPGEDTDVLSRVELPSGRVVEQVKVLRQPHDLAVTADGMLYVADEFGKAVSVVKGGSVVATLPGLVQPGGAAGTGDTGTVVDVRARLLHVYRGGREVAVLPAGAGPTHALEIGLNDVLVTDTTGGALLRYRVDGRPRLVGTTALPGKPYGTAYDNRAGRAFITATASNQLVSYDITPHGLTEVHRWPTVRNAYCVAVVAGTGRLVVASESESQLEFIDP
jgi:DNA-binding beta-propeller fold protein YncE